MTQYWNLGLGQFGDPPTGIFLGQGFRCVFTLGWAIDFETHPSLVILIVKWLGAYCNTPLTILLTLFSLFILF